MNKVLVDTNWDSDDFVDLFLDSKLMFFYLLSSPTRGYLDVFELKRHHASLYLGIIKNQIDNGIRELESKGYIETFGNYVRLKRSFTRMRGGFNETNARKELERLPVDVRNHFYPDDKIEVEDKVVAKKEKPGRKADTVKSVIKEQHDEIQEALMDLVEDRIERNKPPTTRAIKGWVNKLNKMYPNNYSKQIESIQQTIEKGWMGLFEVRDDYNNQKKGDFM